MSSIEKDCMHFVTHLSDLDPDEPLVREDREYFIENRELIIPLLKMYEWDQDFLSRLLALSE